MCFVLIGSIVTCCLPGGSVVKNPPPNGRDARETGSIPGLGRSHGVGNGNPLQYGFVWEIPWTEEPGRLLYTGSQKRWTGLSNSTATQLPYGVGTL